jgi:hypothetical protein
MDTLSLSITLDFFRTTIHCKTATLRELCSFKVLITRKKVKNRESEPAALKDSGSSAVRGLGK